MIMRPLIRILSLLLCFFIFGCTSYEYILPSTTQGKQCVEQCRLTYNSCLSEKKEIATREKERCEDRSDANYNQCQKISAINYGNCLRYPQKDGEECKPKACYRASCTYTPQTSSCSQSYDSCFVSCGGKIVEVKK